MVPSEKPVCTICEKSEPAPDRGVYLAHGNGGAYGTAPAHSTCVQKAIDDELPVTGWNEEPGWYVRGDVPKLPVARVVRKQVKR